MIDRELGLLSQHFDGVKINAFEWNGLIHHPKPRISTAPGQGLHRGYSWRVGAVLGWTQGDTAVDTGPKVTDGSPSDLRPGERCVDNAVSHQGFVTWVLILSRS